MLKEVRLQAGIVILLVLVVLLAFLFGSGSSGNTPESALRSISSAIDSHDEAKFDKFVDLDSLLNSAYDDFVVGTLDSDRTATDQTRRLVGDFTDVIKIPLLNHVNESIHNYVKTGQWQDDEEKTDGSDFVARTGLDEIKFTSIDDVTVSEDGQSATAHIKASHEDLNDPFTFTMTMKKVEDYWRVVKIDNFKDFTILVYNARHSMLEKYLKALEQITSTHDKTVMDYEVQYGKILSEGSLGNDSTRGELKNLMDRAKVDWENRKEEILKLQTPETAETLSHLWVKICDHQISYTSGYSLWMIDKKADTVRDAEMNLKQAKTLEQEAKSLLSRMELDLGIPETIPATTQQNNQVQAYPNLLPDFTN